MNPCLSYCSSILLLRLAPWDMPQGCECLLMGGFLPAPAHNAGIQHPVALRQNMHPHPLYLIWLPAILQASTEPRD